MEYQSSTPTYHHYRSAGTLFYNTHPNELINAFRGGQRTLRPTLRSKGQMSTQSVPNIHQMSTIEPPIDYLLPNSHLNLAVVAGNSNVIVSSSSRNESRTESLQRRRSMSHHETMSSDRRIVSASQQPVYTTIGNYQAYPKLIQRHQSVREPMMSMVPEEGSLTPSEIQPNKSPTPITAGSGGVVPSGEQPTPTPRKRAVETLNNIKTVGTVINNHHHSSGQITSDQQIHKNPNGNYTLPRRIEINKKPQQFSTFNKPIPAVQSVQELGYLVYKSHDSGISSNGFANLSPNKIREEGDGEEYSHQTSTLRIQDKYPLEPPEVPPRDYTTDEDHHLDNGEADYSEEEMGGKYEGDILGLSTMYKIGSKPDLVMKSDGQAGAEYKVVDDYSGVSNEKPNLVFAKSESLADEEEGVPMKHWLNGWQNQSKTAMDDKQSTLSRYWTMDRSLQRRLQKTNYQHIKRLCRDRGQLFEDPDFPPTNRSIYRHKKPALSPIVWLRPHEICQRPKFIAEGASRFDVEQGEQGDPWLLAAVSSLTLTPKFLDRVVPPDQNFEHGYCGVFRFRFWHFGDWVEVLIDDRLPTHKGRLVYLHSTDPTEFWAALLEKAYAKLYGNYEALQNGFTTKALQDLTGGIVQSFSLNSQDRLLTYQVLNSAVPRSTLLIASINIDSRHDNKRHLRLRNGLITRHAYSVTGLARVRGQLGDTHLVRLRNPWGKGEWNGPWSERSWEWDSLSDRDKELLSVRVRNEGEFWMAFDDFAKQFSHLDLVHIGPDDWMSEPSLQSKKPWRAVLARRRWRSGYNAGGSPSYVDTTSMNPQFHIQIPRSPNLSKCHVVVSVTQQYETNVAETKKRKKRKLHHIGFAVYEVPPHMTRLTPLYVAEHQPLDVTNHSVAREVVTFFTLPPGDYIVVPQTAVPNCDGKFLLRILTDEQSNIWEVNEDNVLFRNVLVEFEESFKYGYFEDSHENNSSRLRIPVFASKSENRILLSKLINKYPPEIDASVLRQILRGHWKAYLLEKPTLELCKSLVMLRDYNISGRINLMEIPVLLHMLHFWRSAFLKYVPGSSGVKTSSFNLRLILWEAGITVSNKVLECLILRFSKSKLLSSEAYVIVMIRLHLAHERYHSIDTKMKGNPLSLEEMILMTIYS